MKNSEYVGKTIMIHWLQDDPEADKYAGRVGVVKEVDDLGQLHGTWGGLAVIPEVDDFEVVKYEDPDDVREEAMLEEYNGKTVAEVLAEFEADDDLSGAVDFLEDYLGYDIQDAETLERDRNGFSKDYDFDYVYVDDMGMEWPISDFSDIYFIVEENGTDLDPVEGLEEELKVRDNAFVMDHKEEESENQALKSAKPISSQAAVKAAIKDRVDLHADKIKDAIKDANPGKEVDHVCEKEPVVLHSEDDLKDLKESIGQSIEEFNQLKKIMSPGIAELLKTKPEFRSVINQSIKRFLDGDFGDVPETINKLNDSDINDLPLNLRNLTGFYNCTAGVDNELIKLVILQDRGTIHLLLFEEVKDKRSK